MKTIQFAQREDTRTSLLKIERSEAGIGTGTRIKTAGSDNSNTISLSLPSQARPLSRSGSTGRNATGRSVNAFATGRDYSRTTIADGSVISIKSGQSNDSFSTQTMRTAGSFANSAFVSGTRSAVAESSVSGTTIERNQFVSSSFVATRTGSTNVTTKTVSRIADQLQETGGRSLSISAARLLLTGDIAAISRAA